METASNIENKQETSVLKQSMDSLVSVLQAQENRIKEKEAEEKRKKKENAKSIIGVGLGAVGAKIGAFIGGHIAASTKGADVMSAAKKLKNITKASIEDVPYSEEETAWKEIASKNHLEYMREQTERIRETSAMQGVWAHVGLWGLFGAFVGLVIATPIGYKRGDRLEDPMDLLRDPWGSAKKLFGPAPKNSEKEEKFSEDNKKNSDHTINTKDLEHHGTINYYKTAEHTI